MQMCLDSFRHTAVVASRLRCTQGRRVKIQNVNHRMKRQEGFGTCDISLPPVPLSPKCWDHPVEQPKYELDRFAKDGAFFLNW